jgi:hypothetical protein
MATGRDSGWDLSVDNRAGQLTLVVEVKRKTGASPQWAASLRSNILAHGTFPKAPYFLMVFPDKFYLWTGSEAQLDHSEPTYTVDADPILKPYLKQVGVTAEKISDQSLELIVESWLREIIHSENPRKDLDKSQHWVIDSGLYAALAGGEIEHEAAA